MTIIIYKLLLGFTASTLIGFIAYTAQLLTKSGFFAVLFIGTMICCFGPWITWLLMILFFISSGCIHLLKKDLSFKTMDSITNKGNTRDGWQVLANSLPALFCIVIFYFTNNQLFLIAYVSGIAGATADTWASEIGILSKQTPRSVTTFKPVASGLSGGVSLLGLTASFLGSLLIAFVFGLFYSTSFLIPLICGVLGCLFDSFLGATLQVKYRCTICGKLIEKRYHHQLLTKKVSGISWLSNDWVNFLSGIFTVCLSISLCSI